MTLGEKEIYNASVVKLPPRGFRGVHPIHDHYHSDDDFRGSESEKNSKEPRGTNRAPAGSRLAAERKHKESAVDYRRAEGRKSEMKTKPNNAMEPIPVNVTVPADAGTAPFTSMAHLER